MWWPLLNLLSLTLAVAFIVVRRRSTTTGIVRHAFHTLDCFIVMAPLFLLGIGAS